MEPNEKKQGRLKVGKNGGVGGFRGQSEKAMG